MKLGAIITLTLVLHEGKRLSKQPLTIKPYPMKIRGEYIPNLIIVKQTIKKLKIGKDRRVAVAVDDFTCRIKETKNPSQLGGVKSNL